MSVYILLLYIYYYILYYARTLLLHYYDPLHAGPALQLELVTTYIDWNASSQSQPSPGEAYTALYNPGSTNLSVRSVQLPTPISWNANETLLQGKVPHTRCMRVHMHSIAA